MLALGSALALGWSADCWGQSGWSDRSPINRHRWPGQFDHLGIDNPIFQTDRSLHSARGFRGGQRGSTFLFDPYGFYPFVAPWSVYPWPISNRPVVITHTPWGQGFGPNAWAAPQFPAQNFPVPVQNFAAPRPVGPPPRPMGPPANQIQPVDFRIPDVDINDPLDEIRRRAAVLKPSTPGGRTRADRLISSADEYFSEGNYARAVARYRDAIAKAADYAEPHFRLAHAYVSTRRFNLALKSALTALELAGTARRDGFSLEEMYRGAKFSRQQHDAILVDALAREPEDGGLMFLVGLTYHYGGKPLEAREMFRASEKFPGAHQAYTRLFLPIEPVQEIE